MHFVLSLFWDIWRRCSNYFCAIFSKCKHLRDVLYNISISPIVCVCTQNMWCFKFYFLLRFVAIFKFWIVCVLHKYLCDIFTDFYCLNIMLLYFLIFKPFTVQSFPKSDHLSCSHLNFFAETHFLKRALKCLDAIATQCSCSEAFHWFDTKCCGHEPRWVRCRLTFEQQRSEGDQRGSEAGDQISVGLVVPGGIL